MRIFYMRIFYMRIFYMRIFYMRIFYMRIFYMRIFYMRILALRAFLKCLQATSSGVDELHPLDLRKILSQSASHFQIPQCDRAM